MADPSVARVWNERALAAIRNDTPHPPAQARNLFSLSVCMYDAWAAYDSNGAVGYVYRGKHSATDIEAARREAISYAAYRILKERHAYSRTASLTLAANFALMTSLGYSPNNNSLDPSTPAGVGNSVYAAASAWFLADGARQTNGIPFPDADPPVAYPDYPADQGGYIYANPSLTAALGGIVVSNVNHWQRLMIVNAKDQNGFPTGPIQDYLGAHWLGVRPFAMTRGNSSQPWFDLPPPPSFGTSTHDKFVQNVVEVIRSGSQLTPDDGVTVNISPGAFGNNSLGSNDGSGHPINPATDAPYLPNVVKRGDLGRVLAEFWADGPSSETPPGHWNVFANFVADHPASAKRIGGTGPVVSDLEWDVKVYFALNAAVHDAGCAAWATKRYFNGCRPISAVRYLGQLGQSSDPLLPSYNARGLPLVPGLIELVTASTSVPGGKHEGLNPGRIVVLGWPGQPPAPSTTSYRGVVWKYADAWIPYQRTNFVTPAFPGYISGHSTFSRAAAEVMTAVTGSRFFPGGMASYTAPALTGLGFELGPSQTVQLQWATYYDAADQAGLSRIYGGIHPPIDDFAGRKVGSLCGKAAWNLSQRYFDGSVTHSELACHRMPGDRYEVQYTALRGFSYQLQSAPGFGMPFTDDGPPFNQPFEAGPIRRIFNTADGTAFHRVVELSPH